MLRRSPRTLGLWAGAIALALVTGSLVAGDLATLRRRAGSLGPEEPVVVARTWLPLGATITPGDVTTRRVHASQAPRGALHDVADALGRVVQVPVVRDGYVHAAHLAPTTRDGLAGALPAGTRAVEITVGGGLRPEPGSAVDVYASSASFASGVDALGTGRTVGDGAILAAAGAVVIRSLPESVTLLVAEADAGALADASARGTLFLALVPPEDARLPGAFTRR
ncbi:MAG: Flp pilus assembly protein CpaB [Actinobacteria bacterium]|nr:Flp pilus assembly protein CpaB [Actinomycetota bacterium]